MKPNRFALVALLMVALVGLPGCGHNTTSDTEAEVVLTTNSVLVPIYADMANQSPTVQGYLEVVFPTLVINSKYKSPSQTSSTQNDAILNQCVVTCTRTDGGTVASPSWQNFITMYVPAGGTVTFTNYPIFPPEYFKQPPLNQLLPENGNVDKETGKHNIRERLHIAIYGKTVAGKSVSLEFDQNINFFYVTF